MNGERDHKIWTHAAAITKNDRRDIESILRLSLIACKAASVKNTRKPCNAKDGWNGSRAFRRERGICEDGYKNIFSSDIMYSRRLLSEFGRTKDPAEL